MSVYLSAEYIFGIRFNAEHMDMNRLSDELKKIILTFRNFTHKEKASWGGEYDKLYVENFEIHCLSDKERTIADGSHGIYVSTEQNRNFSEFDELEDAYRYLYNKEPVKQKTELLSIMLKKNRIDALVSDIANSFRYGVKKCGGALRLFKYRYNSVRLQRNEDYYNTKCVLFIDVMFDKDAESEGMTCEDVLYDLSEKCVADRRMINISRYVDVCFRFWNENMGHKIKTGRDRVYSNRYGFHAMSYHGTGPYGGSKNVPLRNFFEFSNRYKDKDKDKSYAEVYAAFPDKYGKLSNTPMRSYSHSDVWKNVFNVSFSVTDDVFYNKPYFDESEVRVVETDKIYEHS